MGHGLNKSKDDDPVEDLSEQLVTAAMELAAEGGFERVRQRDVAARAGVTLRTLYKRFKSKDELLAAGMSRMSDGLERRLSKKPVVGATHEQRLAALFETVTRALCAKPHLARTIVRVMASGVPEVAANVMAYQGRMQGMVFAALRNEPLGSKRGPAVVPSEREEALVSMLLQMWFASLVGWSAGVHSVDDVIVQMNRSVRVIFRGLAEEPANHPRR